MSRFRDFSYAELSPVDVLLYTPYVNYSYIYYIPLDMCFLICNNLLYTYNAVISFVSSSREFLYDRDI